MFADSIPNRSRSVIKLRSSYHFHKYKRIYISIIIISFSITLYSYVDYEDYNNETNVDFNFSEVIVPNIIHRVFGYDQKLLSDDLKFILLWTHSHYAPLFYLGKGTQKFRQLNCLHTNCYVTENRNLFGGNLSKFHAIAFNGRNIHGFKKKYLPNPRWPHQKYIFFNMESSDNSPVCNDIFDNFFNWTSTYKLNSDIPYPYVVIKNKHGKILGPKINMKWDDNDNNTKEDLPKHNKTKAAAWFASNCESRSRRNEYVKSLQIALNRYGLDVDVYGDCGNMRCPRSEHCNEIIERDYFFYMSMENSFADDYVTEKIISAMKYKIVPVVYGGANYSRFLPPGSYVNARARPPRALAEDLHLLIDSPKDYYTYLKRKGDYVYLNPAAIENVCAVCAALNNKTMMETKTVYKEFRKWWNPNFESHCPHINETLDFTIMPY